MKGQGSAIVLISITLPARFFRRVDNREIERRGRLFSASSRRRTGARNRSAFAVRDRAWGVRLDEADSAVFNHVVIFRGGGWRLPSRLDAIFILSDFGVGCVNIAAH